MGLPIDDNHGRLSYWLFYAQRCVAYAFAEVMRAHCEERGKPYDITPPQWGALSLLLAQDGLTIGTMSQIRGVDARWERFDRARTWAAVAGFALFLTATALMLAAH